MHFCKRWRNHQRHNPFRFFVLRNEESSLCWQWNKIPEPTDSCQCRRTWPRDALLNDCNDSTRYITCGKCNTSCTQVLSIMVGVRQGENSRKWEVNYGSCESIWSHRQLVIRICVCADRICVIIPWYLFVCQQHAVPFSLSSALVKSIG